MVDMRKIYKAQMDFVKAIAEDIVKHNASKKVINYAEEYAHLENEYGEFWRVNWGEAYAYVDIDENGKPTGNIWWSNEEMGVEHNGTYEETLSDLESMTIEEAYNNSQYSDCYDEYEGKEEEYVFDYVSYGK